MPLIHASAIVEPSARIAPDVEIGPYSVIGSGVEIDSGCWIGPHVVISGDTSVGENTRIFQFASLGEIPQDKKYSGEVTRLEIGANNTIREYVSINTGSVQDAGVTRLGNGNWIMAYVHIAHDCQIGNNTVFANGTTLAGHVHVGDYVTLGGNTLIHQFCHIGAYAFTAYGARVNKDVPPFVMVSEGKGRPRGLNVEGLRRHGFSSECLSSLKEAYRILYRSDLSLEVAAARIRGLQPSCRELDLLLGFVENSPRSIIR